MKKVYLAAYIGDNLGDDLFLDILARRYKETVFSIYTLQKSEARFPENIELVMSPKERKYIYKLKWIDAIANKVWLHLNLAERYIEKRKKSLINQSDCVVYIIGSGFMEKGSVLESDAFYESHPYVLGCNFGPYESQNFYDKCYSHFALASDVCFRDSYSEKLFSDLPNVRSEMDVVFSYEGEAIAPSQALFERYILISVMNIEKDKNNTDLNGQYIEFIKKCIKELLRKDKKIALIGFCKAEKDDGVIKELLLDFKNIPNIMSYQYPDITLSEAVGLFKYAESVIATRYHAVILSMLFGKKVYPIVYSDKTVHVLEDIDDEIKYVRTNQLVQMDAVTFLSSYGYTISKDIQEKIRASSKNQFRELDKILLGAGRGDSHEN